MTRSESAQATEALIALLGDAPEFGSLTLYLVFAGGKMTRLESSRSIQSLANIKVNPQVASSLNKQGELEIRISARPAHQHDKK